MRQALRLLSIAAALTLLRSESLGSEKLIAGGAADSLMDVQYCAGDTKRRMDVFYPSPAFAPPRPVVMYIHGGSWSEGDKSLKDEHVLYLPMKAELLKRGYVFATVNYRLAVQARGGGAINAFPAPVEDVKCAVRHLRHDARRYRIDGRRIGLWGHSAGAHLASMLGTLPAGRFEGQSGYSGTSSRVQAVLPQAAITELDRPGDFTGLDPYLNRAFPGYGSSAGLIRRLASPVTYADSSDPPFMLLHGQRDQYVSVQQPSRLYARLGGRARGHRLTIVSGASHSFAGPGQRVLRDLVDSMADFFDVHLGNGT